MKVEIKAKDVKPGDFLLRFGHRVLVAGVSRRNHPVTGTEVVTITYAKLMASASFTPESMVEVDR